MVSFKNQHILVSCSSGEVIHTDVYAYAYTDAGVAE